MPAAAAPNALPENAGLAFRGERIPASARLTPAAAEKLLAARNPNGRPNGDVVRRLALWTRGRLQERWLVDFPPQMDAQEAALYAQPFTLAGRRAHTPDRDLRNALARRDRYLAMPVDGTPAQFTWVDSEILPDDSLLAVARDDDFAFGILTSSLFALWWREFNSAEIPLAAFDSFPWPWPPAALLSSLTRTQEENRLAVAQAARAGDPDRIDQAVAGAFNTSFDNSDEELLARLRELNRTRAAKL